MTSKVKQSFIPFKFPFPETLLNELTDFFFHTPPDINFLVISQGFKLPSFQHAIKFPEILVRTSPK
jgi:hypothetical protein